MSRPIVEVFCGPIASGKSIEARARATEGWVIVNDDAIVLALHAGNYARYDKALKPLYKGVELAILSHALALGQNVVIDRPCHRLATRRRYVELAHGFDAQAHLVLFDRADPAEHAARRFTADPRGLSLDDWKRVARAHEAAWESVRANEGWDAIYTVHDPARRASRAA